MGAYLKFAEQDESTNAGIDLPAREFTLINLPRPARSTSSTIHIVATDAAVRARKFRLLTGLGFHCEIYASVVELIDFRPSGGIALVHDFDENRMIEKAISMLAGAGIHLSVVGCAENPTIQDVVSAMQAGALSYLALPFDPRDLSAVVDGLMAKHEAVRHTQNARMKAATLVSRLSCREREVLNFIADGCSNKDAARKMGISPRTVEIHRMKMLGKLGAKGAADAVKIWIYAGQA